MSRAFSETEGRALGRKIAMWIEAQIHKNLIRASEENKGHNLHSALQRKHQITHKQLIQMILLGTLDDLAKAGSALKAV